MSTTCETCGQLLVEHEGMDHAGEGQAQPEEHSEQNEVVSTRSDLRRFLPLLVLVVLALAAAFWFVWARAFGETHREVPQVPDDEPAELSLAVVDTRQANAAAGIGGKVSYLSNEGLVLLNLESGVASIFEVQAEPVGMTGRLLMANDGDKTFRVDSDDPQVLSILSAFGQAWPSSISRIIHLTFEPAARPGQQSATIMSLDGGLIGEPIPLPVGSTIENVEHFGMVVKPSFGGTFALTRNGLEQLSEHSVVAIGGNIRVEVRCDDSLSCEQIVLMENEDQVSELMSLPEQGEVSLSPDGSRLIVFGGGALSSYRLADGSISSPQKLVGFETNEVDGKAGWSRNSERFAWLSNDGRVVTIADADGVEVARLDLRALGLPAASRPTVVLADANEP